MNIFHVQLVLFIFIIILGIVLAWNNPIQIFTVIIGLIGFVYALYFSIKYKK